MNSLYFELISRFRIYRLCVTTVLSFLLAKTSATNTWEALRSIRASGM